MNVGLSKAEARAGILSLVNNYIENKRIIDSYSETDTRIKLIDRMFEYLGWDVGGKEIPDEVQREEGIRDKLQKTKKADYVFRISSISRLVVEAKATGIGLEDRATIQQTVNLQTLEL